jgi:hypothetical protein
MSTEILVDSPLSADSGHLNRSIIALNSCLFFGLFNNIFLATYFIGYKIGALQNFL